MKFKKKKKMFNFYKEIVTVEKLNSHRKKTTVNYC